MEKPIAVPFTSELQGFPRSVVLQEDNTRRETVKELIHKFETHPWVAETHRAPMVVSETNDMGDDVLCPGATEESRRSRTTRQRQEGEWCIRIAGRVCVKQADQIEVQQYRRVLFALSVCADWERDGQDRAPKVIGACNAVRPTKSRPSGSCRSSSFGGALRSMRHQSQLESEPCEAAQNNPSGRHASSRLRTGEARLELFSVGGRSGSGDQSRDVRCDRLGHGG